MRTIAWIGVVCVVLLALAGPAQAAKNFGLGVKIGYHNFVRYQPVDDPDNDGVLEDGEIDYAIDSGAFDGVTIEADFEYRFNPYFILGGGLQWYGADVEVDSIAERTRVRGDYQLSVVALTVTPKVVLPLDIVDLYTGGGMGIYWRAINTSFTLEGQSSTNSENNVDSAGAIGFHAVVGAEFPIKDWIGFVLEDRFAFVHFKGQDPTTDLDDSDAGGNSAFAGARFHF